MSSNKTVYVVSEIADIQDVAAQDTIINRRERSGWVHYESTNIPTLRVILRFRRMDSTNRKKITKTL